MLDGVGVSGVCVVACTADAEFVNGRAALGGASFEAEVTGSGLVIWSCIKGAQPALVEQHSPGAFYVGQQREESLHA